MKKSTFIRNNKLVTRSRNERGQFVRGDFEKLNIYALVNQLQEKARDILDNIESYIGYEHRLGNLVDSTACAVYVDGELVEDSIEYAYNYELSQAPSRFKKQSYAFNSGMTGREAIEDWFDAHRTLSATKNTVQLVAVAAMHYGYYLETGSYGGPKIKVISGLGDAIERNIMGLANEAGYRPSMSTISNLDDMF